MTRVIVTGGSGFIGRHCLDPLLDAGAEVVSLGRTAPDNERVRHVECDLLDDERRSAAMESIGGSHLLHLAWDLTPGVYAESPANIDWLSASLGLVREFADSGGRRVVVAGSCFEYEWSVPVLDEDSPIAPETFYGMSKDLLRQALNGYSARGGPELAWARLFFLYGPGENDRRLAGVVTSSLLEGRPVETSEGTQRRDYMFVGDAGRALAAVTLSDLTGAVNVATGTAIPVRDLVETIANHIGRPELVAYGARPTPPGEAQTVEAATARLTNEIGFTDLTGLEDGVAATVDWWESSLGKK